MADQGEGQGTELVVTEVMVSAIAEHVANGVELKEAIKTAGYQECSEKMIEICSSDQFFLLVAERRERHIQTTLVPTAYNALKELLTDLATPKATKLSAVKLALELGGVTSPAAPAKLDSPSNTPKEQTVEQLAERARKAADAVKAWETKAMDAKPVNESQISPNAAQAPHKRHSG